MKLSRYWHYNGKLTLFKFDFYRSTPDTREEPGTPEEIHLIEMLDGLRDPIPLPEEDSEEMENIIKFLFDSLAVEDEPEP